MMYACYKYSDGTMGDAFEVYEENLAASHSAEELRQYLIGFGKATAEEENKEKIAGSEITIALLKEGIDEDFTHFSVNEFWERFSPHFEEWRKIGERIHEAMKRFEGKDSYWEINSEEELTVAEHKMDDHYHYDFRISLLSGNCFATKEEAEAFYAKIVEMLKEQHGPDADIDQVDLEFVLTAMEMIHNWQWSNYGGLSAPVHPVMFIYPMSIHCWRNDGVADPEDTVQYRAQWNVFATYKEALSACRVLMLMFIARSMQFPGTIEQQLYDDITKDSKEELICFSRYFDN